MNQLTDEQWAHQFFAPLRAVADQPIPPSDCIRPPRIWRVASGLADWDDDERKHLEGCPRCRKRLEQFLETISSCPAPGKPAAQPSTELAAFPTEPVTVAMAARSAAGVAEENQSFDAVPAIALEDGRKRQPASTTAQRWQLVASRRQVAVDGLPGAGGDEQTEIAVLRREDGIVQVRLDGFLLPQPGESVSVEVHGSDGECLASARLPDGDDVADLDDPSRPVQDGDRLRITRRHESTGATLEIEVEIRRGPRS